LDFVLSNLITVQLGGVSILTRDVIKNHTTLFLKFITSSNVILQVFYAINEKAGLMTLNFFNAHRWQSFQCGSAIRLSALSAKSRLITWVIREFAKL